MPNEVYRISIDCPVCGESGVTIEVTVGKQAHGIFETKCEGCNRHFSGRICYDGESRAAYELREAAQGKEGE